MAKGRVYGHIVDQGGRVVGRVRDLRAGGLVELRIDAREIEGLGKLLERAAGLEPAAVARALNRTATETRTAMTRALVAQTGLKYGLVRKALFTSNATAGHLSAAIIAKGSFVPLAAFKARQTRPGVSAAPWNTRRVFAHTFIVRKFGGNVYVRAGKGRFPLHKLYGPAIPRELPRDQSKAAFEHTVPLVLLKRLDHELGRLLGG